MDSSSKSNDKQNSNQPAHHDAWSGWGALIGAASGGIIGLFFHLALILAGALGIVGWLVGALIDRSRL